MNVKYIGPSPEVVIMIDGGGIHAVHGEAVEVPDELGVSLCEQATFEEVKAHRKKTAGPAASEKSAAEPQEEI